MFQRCWRYFKLAKARRQKQLILDLTQVSPFICNPIHPELNNELSNKVRNSKIPFIPVSRASRNFNRKLVSKSNILKSLRVWVLRELAILEVTKIESVLQTLMLCNSNPVWTDLGESRSSLAGKSFAQSAKHVLLGLLITIILF